MYSKNLWCVPLWWTEKNYLDSCSPLDHSSHSCVVSDEAGWLDLGKHGGAGGAGGDGGGDHHAVVEYQHLILHGSCVAFFVPLTIAWRGLATHPTCPVTSKLYTTSMPVINETNQSIDLYCLYQASSRTENFSSQRNLKPMMFNRADLEIGILLYK